MLLDGSKAAYSPPSELLIFNSLIFSILLTTFPSFCLFCLLLNVDDIIFSILLTISSSLSSSLLLDVDEIILTIPVL